MSLIQEALRRKQQEESGEPVAPSDVHAQPARPAWAPAEEKEHSRAAWIGVVRFLCYLLIVLGAMAGLYSFLHSMRTTPAPEPPPAPAEPAAVIRPVVDAPGAGSSEPVVPVAVVEPVSMAAAASPAVEPAPLSLPPVPPAPPAPDRTPGEWPRVRLTGVMMRPDPRSSAAMLNGEMVDVDSEIEGVRLVEVKSNGVLLRYQGQEQFVRVGKATEPAVKE
jgi:hypothetical protein